ncbi:MAG: phosphoribosylanthranilate isomerase [Pseudohongiella sp.]|nr:phosphoribosylanthranilate isomerase [Pseudohongiella sp.]MDO9521540.1 phosphoribosylanthranilate isomerase [Pseudohongiella sp.]MDP2127714.1 phosphoribosylanthranilate isomerase [Pseudohongiella sp.]
MPSRTRVKICGITRPEDARLAAKLGADALGMVFYAGSKRAVSLEQAQQIRAVVPAFVSMVGLFVNPSQKEVESVLAGVHLDCLQFHGDESPGFCASFGLPYMKAIRVAPGLDVPALIKDYSTACAILLDAWDPVQAGGTGKQFDWSLAEQCVQQSELPIVLAGGLDAGNAAQAITRVRPWALDLSSGVESEPGLKDPERLTAFFDEVSRVRN